MSQILVVEDDRPTHALLVTLVKRCGCDPWSAFDGASALRVIRGEALDGMILDLLLPSVNGFEILREVKTIAPDLLGKTLVVTAAAESTYHDCQEIRYVRGLFRKPFDVQGLEDEIFKMVKRDAQEPPLERARTGGTMRLKIG